MRRFWGAALLGLAAGFAASNLQGQAPDYIAQIVGPVLFALALTLAQACARASRGLGRPDIFGWSLCVFFALAMLALQSTSNSGALRHILEMEFGGILACKAAYEFDRCREIKEGGPMQVIATLFCLLGAVMLVHGVFGEPGQDAIARNEPQMILSLMRIGMMSGVLLSTIVLLWVMAQRMTRRIHELASLDPLTGALNRQALIQQVEREISRTRRRADSRFTLMLLNVDRFRMVNDAHGHGAGDRLLSNVAKVLRATLRDYDLVGRLDGDSFVLLLPGTWGENASNLAARLQKEIAQHAAKEARLKNPITVRMGLAEFGDNGDNWDSMLRATETAANSAKTAGGNCVVVAPRPPQIDGPISIQGPAPAAR